MKLIIGYLQEEYLATAQKLEMILWHYLFVNIVPNQAKVLSG
jgi:hypothetical protein